jgi:hypothetical protein
VVLGQPLDWREIEQEGTGEQPQERIVDALRNRVAALGDAC